MLSHVKEYYNYFFWMVNLMDYNYENLGPEKFQEFSQALLLKEFDKVQCFPVAQPDGGRDAISIVRFKNKANKSLKFIVFQVKFVRNPQSIKNPHKWLMEIIQDELPKIIDLIPKGAHEYYLITNISGTAHIEAGSIDKIQDILDNLPIPAQCLWRDDLNRRLDNAWDLKWSYPEIMTGTDFLRYIIEKELDIRGSARSSTIKAFIRNQYERDRELRFKQVDLHNNLLSLFVDVPIDITSRNDLSYFCRQYFKDNNDSENVNLIGAAALFLHSNIQMHFPKVVLEGAPGQGKSTVTQYICQIYRIRILGLDSELSQLPDYHRPSTIKLPIRVDLRDFSTWLDGRDPFSNDDDGQQLHQKTKSVESFLVAQIIYESGGMDFEIADFIAVGKVSAILLVFDGLDEVADISKRKVIVEEIKRGIKRLNESFASLQVIITSRPSAFANSPGFPENDFPVFRLDALTKSIINIYTNKWIVAKKVHGTEATEIRKVLKEKLSYSHMKDLSRNAMQLSILLNLIYTRGSSLPDKRTALYTQYIDLFFARESEKNSIVRLHRELLLEIHGYLAWVLHCEVEQNHTDGSITASNLKSLILKYLTNEQKNFSHLEELFTGVIERVVFLVSRFEGTYEFEVQPIREYFAARYLYETAPYSPPGMEQEGTKPDRFDAIAANFYWLNVTRFYSGFFSKGELPSLAERLFVLAEKEGYKHLLYPRELAAMLLSDWVFSQDQRSMVKVIGLIVESIGLHSLLTNSPVYRAKNSTDLILPTGCGREQLVEQCWKTLRGDIPWDYAKELIQIINSNTTWQERIETWKRHLNIVGKAKMKLWLKVGHQLGVLTELTTEELTNIVSKDIIDEELIWILLRSNHSDFIENDTALIELNVKSVLDGGQDFFISHDSSIISRFSMALNPFTYILKIIGDEHIFPDLQEYKINKDDIKNSLLLKCDELIRIWEEQQKLSLDEWTNSLSPSEQILETSYNLWGEQWIHYMIANILGGLKLNAIFLPKESISLFDETKPICRRILYAKRASCSWWKSQFDSVQESMHGWAASTILLRWGSLNKILDLHKHIEYYIENMTENKWQAFLDTPLNNKSYLSKKELEKLYEYPDFLTARIVVALGRRFNKIDYKIYLRFLHPYQGSDKTVLLFCLLVLSKMIDKDQILWDNLLNYATKLYNTSSELMEKMVAYHFLMFRKNDNMPLEIAQKTFGNIKNIPRDLLIVAERKYREKVASEIIPVGKIATEDRWFEY